MITPKYDISKSFKLSNENIANIVYIQNKKGFKNDSEVVRMGIDILTALVKMNLETSTMAKILEAVANMQKLKGE
ncbi:hypothetical protein ACHJH3_01830 [Campylobacter sp. MOP7]|uniref:hypothetical protein n=1 Tax=Campylobacter canis TaxID=3378588 RepID=UPI00387EA45C